MEYCLKQTPNDVTSIAVMEVTPNPSNSLTVEVTIQITAPDKHYISALPQEGKAFKHFHYTWNSKNTDFAIRGFLAGLYRSPLILCLLFQDTRIASRLLTPEIFSLLISLCSSVGVVCGKEIFCIRTSSLSSAISFSNKGLKWFGQDQDVLAQASRE